MELTLTRTDEELVAAVARQEDDAIDLLVERYWRRSYLVAHGLVGGDPAAAEDVAQETFVQVLRSAGRFQAGASFRPWFFQILRNVAAKQGRGEERRRRREEAAQVAPVTTSATDQVDAREAVRTYLQALTPALREALTLHFLEGLTHREVAEVMGCPAGTASDRIRTGLERLRGLVPATAALGAAAFLTLGQEALAAPGVPAAPTAVELAGLAARATTPTVPDAPSAQTLTDGVTRAKRRAFVRGVMVIGVVSAVAGGLVGKLFRVRPDDAARWAAADDVSVPVPAGWAVVTIPDGAELLAREATLGTGFADNVTVVRTPSPGAVSLELLEAEHRRQLSQPPFRLHRLEAQERPGQRLLLCDYESQQQGKALRHLALVAPDGKTTVVVTVTALAERWGDVAAVASELLAGTRLGLDPPEATPR